MDLVRTKRESDVNMVDMQRKTRFSFNHVGTVSGDYAGTVTRPPLYRVFFFLAFLAVFGEIVCVGAHFTPVKRKWISKRIM